MQLTQLVKEKLDDLRHFAVANTSSMNGTVERVNQEVNGTFRTVFNERCRLLSEWPTVLPVV